MSCFLIKSHSRVQTGATRYTALSWCGSCCKLYFSQKPRQRTRQRTRHPDMHMTRGHAPHKKARASPGRKTSCSPPDDTHSRDMPREMAYAYKQDHPFEKRAAEAARIREKYPDRIPVICEKEPRSDIAPVDKRKYLIPIDLTVGQFVYVIRKRISIPPEKAIFIFVNNTLPPTAALMSTVYEQHKDEDGFMYMMYSGENTFGRPLCARSIDSALLSSVSDSEWAEARLMCA